MPHVAPSDDAAHQDGLFMHEVSAVNSLLGGYVLRFLDADAGRTSPIPTDAERALADRLAELAEALRARASRRDLHGDPPHLLARLEAHR